METKIPFLWLLHDHLETCLSCPSFPACRTHSTDLDPLDQSAVDFLPTYLESISAVCTNSCEHTFMGWNVLVWEFICLMQITTTLIITAVLVKRSRHCVKGLKFRRIISFEDE